MPNEDIITALRNAVEHGESLEVAMNILINSGYNPREVQEASRFVGTGATINLQQKSEEELIMPSEKSFFSRTPKRLPYQRTQPIQQNQQPTQQSQELLQQLASQSNLPSQQIHPIPQQQKSNLPSQRNMNYSISQTPSPFAQELRQIKPPKKSYAKEIILLIILLILIGVLIITILFRDRILGFFG